MKLQLRHRLSLLNDAATKRVIKQFGTKYHLVYFGAVDAQEDDHQLIRGLTVSTSHTDNHYTVGTFEGHDLMLVQRRNVLTFPGKPDIEYKWLIMEIDLNHTKLPHIFMDGHRHDETFYANMFVKVPHFHDATSHVAARDPHIATRYKIFALPNQLHALDAVMIPEITNTLSQHFHQFDFEIIEDRLYIYASGHMVTLAVLQEMLRAGTWLAAALDAVQLPD
ncbi:MAG TPA: hypothetical protein VJM32_03955 [Candidatus Saccharimonadales bacterium]|nr:hypothetical protein [Candidatus Saccharimonadales bacterium]